MGTRARLLAALTILITLSGCASLERPIVLHPITNQDFHQLKKGDAYTAPGDGYFLSKYFFDEVEKAKVEAVKNA